MSTRGIIVGIAAASVVVASAVAVSSASATASSVDAEPRAVTKSSTRSSGTAHVSARRAAPRPNAASAIEFRTRGHARAAVSTRVVLQKQFSDFTLRSRATRDVRGVEASLYRGKYFRSSVESKRRCIATRESEGHYDVVSPSGLYYGAYQVSRPLARGATWMMLREHKQLMGVDEAKAVLAQLRTTPMNRWPRYWQDAAFHTVMNWQGVGSGAFHWAGGRWHC